MNRNPEPKKKKKKNTAHPFLWAGVTVIALILLNLLAFFGLLYQDGGTYRIPSDAVSVGTDPQETPSKTDSPSGGVDRNSDTKRSVTCEQQRRKTSDLPPSPEDEKYSYAAQNFKADLSAYEEYMNPAGDAYLQLVNVENPLTKNDVPEDLTPLASTRDDGRDPQRMRKIAAKALEALFLEAEKDGILYSNNGIVLSVTSAYRSYGSQESIFNNYVKETMAADRTLSRAEAEKKVMTYSCRPGTSEHQSGLCCDMHNFPSASVSNGMREKFAESKAGKWLVENCARFGFVLRFPADKTEVTGIDYESWHFRFVGRYHAMRMQESGMCLEEYVKTLSLPS